MPKEGESKRFDAEGLLDYITEGISDGKLGCECSWKGIPFVVVDPEHYAKVAEYIRVLELKLAPDLKEETRH